MTSPTQRAEQGNPQTIRDFLPPVNPFLGLLPRRYWDKEKQYYAYAVTDFLVPNGGQSAQNLQLNADADFLVIAISGQETQTDNKTVVANPGKLVNFTDGGTGQSLFTSFSEVRGVRWDTVIGTAQNPFFLPYPRILVAGSIFSMAFVDLEGADRNVSVTLHGQKIYPRPAQQ